MSKLLRWLRLWPFANLRAMPYPFCYVDTGTAQYVWLDIYELYRQAGGERARPPDDWDH